MARRGRITRQTEIVRRSDIPAGISYNRPTGNRQRAYRYVPYRGTQLPTMNIDGMRMIRVPRNAGRILRADDPNVRLGSASGVPRSITISAESLRRFRERRTILNGLNAG